LTARIERGKMLINQSIIGRSLVTPGWEVGCAPCALGRRRQHLIRIMPAEGTARTLSPPRRQPGWFQF